MKHVPEEILREIERHFHAVIRGRAADLISKNNLTLPELTPLLRTEGYGVVPYSRHVWRLQLLA